MTRLPASELTRKRLKQLFDGEAFQGINRSDLVKQAVRLMIEEALEAEVADTLGRGYYDRAELGQGERAPGGPSQRLPSWQVG